MTADERIEKLLNRYGQTIADLPKSADNDWSTHVYESRHLISAKKAALVFWMDEWQDTDAVPEIRYEVEECLLDYICHLSDIIDRMETALNTAKMVASCAYCRNEDGNDCDGCIGESFEIDDSVFTEEDDEFTEEDD